MLVSRRGVVAVLLSNVLFGVLYLYSHFMQPMVGSDVFVWRMAAMLVALSVMMSKVYGRLCVSLSAASTNNLGNGCCLWAQPCGGRQFVGVYVGACEWLWH